MKGKVGRESLDARRIVWVHLVAMHLTTYCLVYGGVAPCGTCPQHISILVLELWSVLSPGMCSAQH